MNPLSARRNQGFTLIEALIVLVLIGVLLGLAAPSFRNYMAGQRVKTASFDLYASLVFARSEAIKRRQPVTLTPQSASDWGTGWNITVGAQTLRTQDPPPGVVITSASTSVVYGQDGRLTSASNVGVLVKPNVSDASLGNRCIRIDLAGLPKSTTTSGTTCP